MALFMNREMKIYNLSDDLKLMAVENLNLEDKTKLVDIFPPVINLIKTFDMNASYDIVYARPPNENSLRHGHIFEEFGDNYFNKGVELFNKLTKVTRIILPEGKVERMAGYSLLKEAVFTGDNLNLRTFQSGERFGSLSDKPPYDIIRYIEHVKKRKPKYNASNITFVFKPHEKILKLIAKREDLQLKLLVEYKSDTLPHVLKDENLMLMIKKLEIFRVKELPADINLESVTDLRLVQWYGPVIGGSVVNNLRKILKCAPNVSNLSMTVSLEDDYNNQQLFNVLIPLFKLRSLKIYIELKTNERKWSEVEVQRCDELTRMLIIANRWPALRTLTVMCYGDFREFSIEHDRAAIKYIELDMELLVNRFSRMKYVEVVTRNREYADRVVADIDMLGDRIRNRYLGVEVKIEANS